MQRSASSTSLWAPTWVSITHVTAHALHRPLKSLTVTGSLQLACMRRDQCVTHSCALTGAEWHLAAKVLQSGRLLHRSISQHSARALTARR